MFVGLEDVNGKEVDGWKESFMIIDARYSARTLVNEVFTASVVEWYCKPCCVSWREIRRSKVPTYSWLEISQIPLKQGK